jgi:hypothetical protein
MRGLYKASGYYNTRAALEDYNRACALALSLDRRDLYRPELAAGLGHKRLDRLTAALLRELGWSGDGTFAEAMDALSMSDKR